MAKIHQRTGQRYSTKSSERVLIEITRSNIIKGRLVDQSKGGVAVTIEGERPKLTPDQKVQVRCRAGGGRAVAKYVTEESPTSFRIGFEWDR